MSGDGESVGGIRRAPGAGESTRAVHFFGHSSLQYSGYSDGHTLLSRTNEELVRLRPDVDWQCDADLLYMAPNMAGRVERLLRDRPGDIAVVRVAEMHFIQEYVVYRVRERWPSLYRRAVAASEALRRLAGGGRGGAPSARGLLFRAPRWLVLKLIGAAPDMSVDDAIKYTVETLDAIVRREDTLPILITSANAMKPNIPAPEAQRRRDKYMAAMKAYCAERRIVLVDPAAEAKREGDMLALGPDGWHGDLAARDAEARMFARAIAGALG